MAIENGSFVLPGDKIGVEEEFVSGTNTYVENGEIFSAIIGNVGISEGKISVSNQRHEIKNMKRGMFVVGKVTDDVRSVMFVKLDNIHVNGVEYIALKDGKIVMPKPRLGMYGDRGGGFDRGRRGPPQPAQKEPKMCGVGDVILARIQYDDPEIYTLSLEDNESGVVYSECQMCSNYMQIVDGALYCNNCRRKERRKISPLYGKPEAIKELLKKY
ncbi:MAG: hypothetical protein M1504_01160 [Candidatus Marsarchaeota archaeon]|nr:hypothetical protein [Candidatus Marsarchaeota archaeon]